MKIPMVDLQVQYESLKDEVDAAIGNVLDSCAFILGPEVEQFETAFAAFHGAEACVAVSNGTDALTLTLRALGIGKGDEVITTPQTFGATLEAICLVGARPVLVDIDPDFYTMRVDQVESVVTERTRVILPVHIYGHPVDMGPLMEIAERHDLFVIEDTAQAHGAEYKGRLVGTIGTAGTFSFYPGKNLGAYGDAGGIVTNDTELAQRLKSLRNHGQQPGAKFYYHFIGYNNRMDGIQGAVLNVKLPRLRAWNDARRSHADAYRAGLGDLPNLKMPKESADARHVYHLFVMETDDRDRLTKELGNAGIASGVQYPHPIQLTPAYAHLGYRLGDFPVYEAACSRIVSLPMYPELTSKQVAYVIDAVRRVAGGELTDRLEAEKTSSPVFAAA
ncbi:MAG: erythromycin biosynthesis sensory transduction protein eryC1 [Gemmatimonadetes bacterium]|nr:erythromycin biosynthesis sensory transduction protein eryC1 [Gemmatimonadota bacterium]|tara:strand:+ start:1848 stop:3017 length:1170 start_codon:yes stop_codon:yes gene_type:complete